MSAGFAGWLRVLVAVLAASSVAIALPGLITPTAAYAQDDDDEEEDEDEEDAGEESSDDDEDSSDDEDEEDEEDETVDKNQPSVTEGGLYTKRSYPQAELDRTLTVIGGMFQARFGTEIDASNQDAFENWFGVLQGQYGITDYFELQFGTKFLLVGNAAPGPGGSNQARFDLGFESAVWFDIVDFRMGFEVPVNPDEDCEDLEACDSFAVDLAWGFPVRYKPHRKFALIALDKLMTIHFADRKPDLTFGFGVQAQIVPPFAVLLRAEIIVGEFNFENQRFLPATAALQLSPNNKLDIALEFTFRDLFFEKTQVAEDGTMETVAAPFDRRSLLIYLQARF